MGHTGSTQPNWFEEVRRITLALVRIRSVSPGEGEIAVAHEVLRLLHDSELEDTYTASGLDLIDHDTLDRQNAYAFLRGQSARTIVLLGHIDTVGMQDYGILEPWASDPDALAERLDALATLAPEIRADLSDQPGDWMFGRGVVDMKSGVAANIAVMRYYAERARAGTPPPLSLVFLATPDEENESAGILQAVRYLLRLRAEYGLDYVGAINTDYITSLYPGDPNWYVYTGTIGKLLPSFLVIGRESHVGDPYDGVDANLLAAELIADLSMSPALCDTVRGQVTPPPVTLHATDLKDTYNVQLPFAAYFYLNVLTFTCGPAELLKKLRVRTEATLHRTLAKIDASEQRWLAMAHEDERAKRVKSRTGIVLSYEELYESAVHVLGEQQVMAALDDEWERWPAALDKRERSLHLTHRLWQLSGKRGPAVVMYYSPPYYPSIAATPCGLHEAVANMIAAHPEEQLTLREYFPFLSDMSYLRLDGGADTPALAANMPVWRSPDAPARPGSYSLPLEAISELDMPVVDIGPYGRGAHQRGERLMMSRSFGMLPQLVHEVIEQLAN